MIESITLDLYLEDHGSARRMAKDTGLSTAAISRARHGYPLSFRASMLVEAASGGRVRAESLCKDAHALAVFRSMVAA